MGRTVWPRASAVTAAALGLALCIGSPGGLTGSPARAGEKLAADDGTPPGKPRFDALGARPGEQLPNLRVYALDGEAKGLRDACRSRPTLLLTSSLTCPKSRSTYPRAAELAERLKGKVDVAIVYVIEAHPRIDPSPYGGREDVTVENQRDRILCRQPTTLPERLKLAGDFRRRLDVAVPVYVDDMDNAAWKALSGGPNMGVLVRAGGVVAHRQGWFDAASMEKATAAFLAAAQQEAAAHPVSEGGFPDFETSRPVREGDVAKLKEQLDRKPDLARYVEPWSARGSEGARTLLHHAAVYGRVDIAELRIAKAADVNAQNEHTPAPLHLAAAKGDAAMVGLLLKHRADVNLRPVKGGAGPTPLQEAVIRGHKDVADLLLKAGAKPTFFTDAGQGKTDALRPRLAADPTVARRPDGWGRTPLAYAAANGQTDAAKLLIEHGAKDEPADAGEELALYWAIRGKHIPMMRLLLAHGSNPNAGTMYSTFLHDAARDGQAEVVRVLLDHKANPKAEDVRGHQPIHAAAAGDRAEIVEMLSYAGADPNVGTGFDRSPCGPIAAEAPLETPLHLAAEAGALEAAKALLAGRADVNARSATVETPLHAAVHAYEPGPKQSEMIRLLLDRAADVNAKDKEGRTPQDLAVRFEKEAEAGGVKTDPAVADLLRARGGRPGAEVAGPPGTPPAPPKGLSSFDPDEPEASEASAPESSPPAPD